MSLISLTKESTAKFLYYLLPALFFVTPLSSSAKSILLGMTVIVIIATPSYRQDLITLSANRWCRTVPLLVLIALLGCLWSPASLAEKGLVLEKWSKLLYLPILIVGFQELKTRQLALNAFLAAMLITCLLSCLIYYTGYLQGKMTADNLFRNHIMTGIMMSFATYLAGIFYFRQQGRMRVIYGILGLLFSYQILFINQSRTGYVVYFLLMSLLLVQMLTRRQAMLSLVLMSTLFASCYYFSKPMQHGVHLVVDNLRSYQENKDTPVGYRLQFHDFAKHLFQMHPLIGGGTGSFTYSFRTENPVPAWIEDRQHSGRLLEPHSQYWLVAAEFGLLGLLAFALFYAELAVIAYRLHATRPIALATLLVLTLGNVSDSLLFYSGSGYFFILILALCFGEKAADNLTVSAQLIKTSHRAHNDELFTEHGL